MNTATLPARVHPPGDLAMWVFILAELLVFALFSAAHAFAWANHVEPFNEYQQTLDRNTALITIALVIAA